MSLILEFVRDKETRKDGFVLFYAPDSRFGAVGDEIGPDNAAQLTLSVSEWDRLDRPDYFGPITLLPDHPAPPEGELEAAPAAPAPPGTLDKSELALRTAYAFVGAMTVVTVPELKAMRERLLDLIPSALAEIDRSTGISRDE